MMSLYMSNEFHSRDLAMVGAGYWGKNLARNFRDLGSLHTICDTNPEILHSYQEGYEEVQKETNFDRVLSNPEIRKIAIATPAGLHYRLAAAAIKAGKDVFVEKPICLDQREGELLVQAAQDQGRILMVGHLLHYHPCIQKLKELIEDGTLGKLHYITSNRLNLGKFRREENALWSFAPHDISVILGLAGSTSPDAVACHGGNYLAAHVADTTMTVLKFHSGLMAHVYVSWLNPFKEQKLTVVGSNGMAVFDDTKPWNEKLILFEQYLTWEHGFIPTPNKKTAVALEVEQKEPLKEECQHFLQCCKDRSSPRTDGLEGLRVLDVLQAAQKSLDSDGSTIPISSPTVVTSDKEQPVIHSTAIVDKGAQIGPLTRVWHFTHVCGGAIIGEACSLGQNVFIGNQVKIGNRVKIQNNVSVYDGVTLEDDVFCGPSMVFTNVYNPRSAVNRKAEYKETLIRKGATLGANCTIVCGTSIGLNAFIGAGAVVNKDVPDYALMVGVPAKQIGWMSAHGEQLNLPLAGNGETICPHTGDRYELKESTIIRHPKHTTTS
jgi:UDP-2-acetamido-3-amino-2,3-dideoxy-glucuronate N-acetyltransferase